MSEYSKYGDPASATQDITSKSQAVCTTRLKEEFFRKHEVRLYLSLTLFIPVIFMVVLAVLVRSVHPLVHEKLQKSPARYHPVLAGSALAGTYLMVFVLCMDCAAVHYNRQRDHEYKEYDVHGEFNFFILLDWMFLCPYFSCCVCFTCAALRRMKIISAVIDTAIGASISASIGASPKSTVCAALMRTSIRAPMTINS